MGHSASGVQLLQEVSKSDKSGCLEVRSGGVTWKVFVAHGKLCYAMNTVQTVEAVKYQLGQLGQSADVTLPISSESDIHAWGSLFQSVQAFFAQGGLTQEQFIALKIALSKDALEPLLWLSEAESSWQDIEVVLADTISQPDLSQVLGDLQTRLTAWQKLAPEVTSPYQCPTCPDVAKINQPLPGGMLNPALLSMLTKLMRGNSIRQLSIVLKQDSLKVAQLLHPYIRHQVLALDAPASPFEQLPHILVANSPVAASATLKTSGLGASSLGQLGNPTVGEQVSAAPKQRKIVCIDDSQAMLDTIRQYLGAEGFDVATVDNPMESLSTLFSMKPDLILMDVSMPGINGNRLCQILRRSSVFKDLPIIMVSGNTGALDKAKAQSAGATDYLTKPFDKSDLLRIVEAYLPSAMVAA